MYQAVNPCIVAAIEGPIIIGNSFLLKPMITSIICIVIAVDKTTFLEEVSAFKQLITEYDTFNKHAKIYSIHSKAWIIA